MMNRNSQNITFMSFLLWGTFMISPFFGESMGLQAQTEQEGIATIEAEFFAHNQQYGFSDSGEKNRDAGGGRNPTTTSTCDAKLQALIPESTGGWVGVEHPEFVVYVGQKGSEGETAQLKLTYYDEDNDETVTVFQKTLEDFPRDQLFAIPLPTDFILEQNQVYKWNFALECDLNRFVRGAMQLKPGEISDEFLEQLATSTPIEKAKIYMNQGWWYDAVKILFELREKKPDNSEALELWTKLLTAEGWKDFL